MKRAILVVSFGTSHPNTRARTIDVIEQEIAQAWPDRQVYRAWTSKMIMAKLLKRDGIKIHNVREAMAQMVLDGITDVIVQPTHVVNGIENDLMRQDALAFRDCFLSLTFGDPLLTTEEDARAVLRAVTGAFSPLPEDEAVVLMGHGTEHHANFAYAALGPLLRDMGFPNFFLGTVEAWPDLDALLPQLRSLAPGKIHLAPFMIVAGDHAKNDLAGDEPDSWKSRLQAEGFQVECRLMGLGEYPAIRQIFLEHIRRADTEHD